MPQFTLKGQTFDSPHDNNEAIRRLSALVSSGTLKSDFPKSLVAQINKGKGLSGRQWPWVHKMVLDAEKAAEIAAEPTRTGFESIQQHILACRTGREDGGKGLLYPKIGLNVDGTEVVMKITGPRSKRPNHVSLSETGRFGEGKFFGYITPAGELLRYRDCSSEVVAVLERIAVDPATVISEMGRESGRCLYCFAELTTAASKLAGCGKKCASNWRAWYPTTAEVRANEPATVS